jgi:hypothetical protein
MYAWASGSARDWSLNDLSCNSRQGACCAAVVKPYPKKHPIRDVVHDGWYVNHGCGRTVSGEKFLRSEARGINPHRLHKTRNLIRGRQSIEDCVSVWEPAESVDDHLVRDRITRPLIITEIRNQSEGQRLVHSILAMLEGEVKKILLLSVHGDVEFVRNGDSGKSACDGIA